MRASARGAGPVGFAGAGQKPETEQAAGLTELAGDRSAGDRKPMLPGDWYPERGTTRLNTTKTVKLHQISTSERKMP